MAGLGIKAERFVGVTAGITAGRGRIVVGGRGRGGCEGVRELVAQARTACVGWWLFQGGES